MTDTADTRLVQGVRVPIPAGEKTSIEANWATIDAATAANAPMLHAEADRKAGLDSAVDSDSTLNSFKAMTNAEFNTWWDANVTTSAQAIEVLKRLARLIIRRVL